MIFEKYTKRESHHFLDKKYESDYSCLNESDGFDNLFDPSNKEKKGSGKFYNKNIFPIHAFENDMLDFPEDKPSDEIYEYVKTNNKSSPIRSLEPEETLVEKPNGFDIKVNLEIDEDKAAQE